MTNTTPSNTTSADTLTDTDTDTDTAPSTVDRAAVNVEIVRRFVDDVINDGRRETVADVLHAGYRYHGPDGHVAQGPDAAWQIVDGFRSGFSDLHAEITSAIAQGDRVALTLVMTGTHDRDFMGIAPTGAAIVLPVAVISRLEDQRIIEEWEYYDSAALIGQLEAASPAGGTTLVLGASGKTGRRVLDRLRSAGVPARAGSRSSDTRFDWDDATTWAPALVGVEAVYIAYYPDLAFPGAADTVGDFADLAVASGVERLVLLSGRGEQGARLAEERVQESGAKWTIVRCAFFNQNFSETFADPIRHGVLAMPGGDTVEPFLDADDIADVAVAALTDHRHSGQLYELTGPRLLTLDQAATELGIAIGRDVSYRSMTVDEYAAELIGYGLPAEEAGPFAQLIGDVLDGRNAHLSDGVQRALGRPPRDFADWARDVAASGAWNLEATSDDSQ
ncbi:MAG: ester cyclase [Ilumatobacter sp.]|uniref:ester cyclase n=1 Tax=Ilumatobacter sp. TaxID=1967498 RepID=UPI003C72C1DB